MASDGTPDAVGNLASALTAAAWQEEHNLISTIANGRVVLSNPQHEQPGDTHQDLISDLVSEQLVDGLKLIQVDKCAGDWNLCPVTLLHEAYQAFLDEGTVEQTREGVAVGSL